MARNLFRFFDDSSWDISTRQCRKEAEAGLGKNRAEIRALRTDYEQGRIALVEFTVERNGNGRDFDIIPSFQGTAPQSYTLSFSLVDSALTAEFHSSGYYLRGAGDRIRIYVPTNFPGRRECR